MHSLVLTLVLAQLAAPSPAVSARILLTRGTGLSVSEEAELVSEVSDVLRFGGIPRGGPEARPRSPVSTRADVVADCRGNRTCLLRWARSLGATHLVLVEAGAVMDDVAVFLEAVEVRGGTSLRQHSFVSVTGDSARRVAEVADFTDRLRADLALPPPPELLVSRVGAPRLLHPELLVSPLFPPRDSREEAEARRRQAAYLTTGGALVGALTATTLWWRGSQRGQATEGYRAAAVASTAVSALLGAIALQLWMREPPAPHLSPSAAAPSTAGGATAIARGGGE